MILTASARRRTPTPPTPSTPPVLTWTADKRTIVPADGQYYAFPGAITCPNGDVLAAFRNGVGHLGAGDLMTMRSTDDGATWSVPAITIPRTATHGYGTATFSLIDATTIALVTWMRPLAGGHPPIDATRIFLSTDNGATWGSPYVVDTSAWLTEYNVSESALIYRDGWYYLGVWGEATENADNYYLAGVIRSTDLSTWERVAFFDSGATLGYNECGVVEIGDYLAVLVRNETAYRWSSVSLTGVTWSPLVSQDVKGRTGAPKLFETFGGFGLVPLRDTSNDEGFMAAIDSGGNLYDLGFLDGLGRFIYGQVCKFSPTTGGVVWAMESSPNAYINWRTFSLTPAP